MDQSITFDSDLIQRYNVNGPRYTSYPTALQFGEFHPDEFKKAIASSRLNDGDLSLYVHLPFCATLCYYCACNKVITRKREPAVEYLDLLEKELDLVAPLFEGRFISQLHWGGGTPTFLEDEQISRLMQDIRARFEFRSDAAGEFSIEVDPRTVDADRVVHLREEGFNRLSLGIQDFAPAVQKAVNRVQSYEDTKDVIEAARLCGFRSISVDLIYGLPFQSHASFKRTLNQIVSLRPDRISIYNYAHLPDRFTPQKRILAGDLPKPEEKLLILELCIELLTASGYIYIGMDHFALPDDELAIAQRDGTLQRNFQGYSTFADCDLLALGVTGISHIGDSYSQNAREMEAYREHLLAGRLPLEKGAVIDEDDQVRKEVINELICNFALQYRAVEERFNVVFADYFAKEMASLKPMIEDGLINLHSDAITVTSKGRLFIRNICMVFDRYMTEAVAEKRFSKAV
ncbi:MAG: oxygen-independent coproporphyrinogen III oxidase [Gammaproteobacteria bacterium]|jgi:oxygen-independent coproporphyrinogen-3 oxidase|nr:oxygen-independent coproporphyrinogen III oxidase [Gammaproteobacteria bacterium]|tara:strand:- start:1196 stop:2575 length:1380 start_codon:yes stop_codon:yes gene_type:complete